MRTWIWKFREPLPALIEDDLPVAREAAEMIRAAIEKYC